MDTKTIYLVWTAATVLIMQNLTLPHCFGEINSVSPLAAYSVHRDALYMPGEEKGVPYLLLQPRGISVGRSASLLIHLYGAGGSIDNYNLQRQPYDQLRTLLAERGYYVLVPELGHVHWMNEHTRRTLDAIVNQILANHPIDRQRVHVMGTSMGGGSALAYAIHRPMLIRSVCSLMGMTDFRQWHAETGGFSGSVEAFGGSPETSPGAYAQVSAMAHLDVFARIPVFLIHGEKDTLVKPQHGRQLATALRARGYRVEHREVSGIGHEDRVIDGFADELVDFFDHSGETPSSAGTQPDIDESAKVEILHTKSGLRFGVWGLKPAMPAPTLFIMSSTVTKSLKDPYFRQCGATLARKGYLCVSVDLPSHGLERNADEPEGLKGWRQRAEQGRPLIEELNLRLTRVLDDLITRGYTNEKKVAACGVSRGGFTALHFAARDPRIRCVAVFAPVTDLSALSEFQGAEQLAAVRSLSLINLADQLAGRPIWIVIGDQDDRVSTDAAIAFARSVTRASLKRRVPARVELHVLPEPKGHTTPAGSFDKAATWIADQLQVREE